MHDQDGEKHFNGLPKPNSDPGDFVLRSRTMVFLGNNVGHFNEALATTLARLPELGRKASQLELAIANLEHSWVERFASELYDAYQVSSGELSRVIPPPRLLACFRLLQPYYRIVAFDEMEQFDELPEELAIFRGGRGPESTLRRGFSWTTDPDIAEVFMESEGDLIVQAVIKKSDVLAYFVDNSECVVGLADQHPVSTLTRFTHD